jgi:DNA-binding CsgD family transcriptional regulator
MNQPAQMSPFETIITPAEARVIGLLQQGMTNREIGVVLFRSEHTIKTHVEHILAKTGAKNRAQVCMLWAMNASNFLAQQTQYTPNGVLGVVSASGSIDVRSSGSSIDKGSKMRSLNTTEIMVVGGGLEIPPFVPWFGAPPPAPLVATPPIPEQWQLREFVSPDDIWRPVQ